jgi:hypothetical protein
MDTVHFRCVPTRNIGELEALPLDVRCSPLSGRTRPTLDSMPFLTVRNGPCKLNWSKEIASDKSEPGKKGVPAESGLARNVRRLSAK